MNPCHHIGWFNLSGRENFHFHYSNRTKCILQEMTNAEIQSPSMMFFIGSKAKDAALRQLFPNNNIRRGYRNGIVNLRLDSSTISSDLPILFADGDPRTLIPRQLGTIPCHEQSTSPLEWQPRLNDDIMLTLYARLIAPFTDVICVFADDFNGLDDVASFLVRWVKMGDPSTSPIVIRPRVLIVAREEKAATYNVLEMEELRHRLDAESLVAREEVFSLILIMHLAGDHISLRARHRRLKELLMTELEKARNERIQQRFHFSALHFGAFFRQSIRHVTRTITEPFDFVASARKNNEVKDDYMNHVGNLVKLCKEYFVPYQSVTSFLASSILMDAYPPGMHSEFSDPDSYQISNHS